MSQREVCSGNKNQNALSLDELRSPLLGPPIFILHALDVIQLSTALTLLAKDNDANSATFKVPCSQRTHSTECAGAKVDGMCSGFREVGGFKPVQRQYECLVAKRARKR